MAERSLPVSRIARLQIDGQRDPLLVAHQADDDLVAVRALKDLHLFSPT
jgi:hypothetical protein